MASTERLTTSATGDRRPASAGFTILELVLVIMIIGLIASLTIGGAARLLRSGPTTPDDIFWKACQAARKTALGESQEVRLSFDPKAKAFVCDDGVSPQTLAVPNPAPDLTIDFHPNQSAPSNQAVVGGVLVETTSIPYVSFYADGTCTPFHVQFRAKGGAHSLFVDPWTCAPLLTAPHSP